MKLEKKNLFLFTLYLHPCFIEILNFKLSASQQHGKMNMKKIPSPMRETKLIVVVVDDA